MRQNEFVVELGNIGVVPTFSGAEPEETAEAIRHRDLILGNGSEVFHYTLYIAAFDFATVLVRPNVEKRS